MKKNEYQQKLLKVWKTVAHILEHGTEAEISELAAEVHRATERALIAQRSPHMSEDEPRVEITPTA